MVLNATVIRDGGQRRDFHDPSMKQTEIWFKPEVYFSQGLSRGQRERAEKAAKFGAAPAAP